MNSFIEIFDMTNDEKMDYMIQYVESARKNAPDNLVLKYEVLKAKLEGIRAKYRSGEVAIMAMTDAILEFTKKVKSDEKTNCTRTASSIRTGVHGHSNVRMLNQSNKHCQ